MKATDQIHATTNGRDSSNAPAAELTVVFFGGVVVASLEEERLAEHIGAGLAAAGLVLRHGGYNGLMEAAARGAASKGGKICAVTLSGKEDEWGPLNPYVTEAVHLTTVGARLDHYLADAHLVIAMGGGVGSLHELTAALYYAGSIRPVPVWLVGPTALRLLAFLQQDKWLFESPTRPLGFLTPIASAATFDTELAGLSVSLKGEA